MSQLLEAMVKENTKTYTENGMRTFSSSLNACVDLFFMGGAFRKRNDNELVNLFAKAFNEDKELAIMLLGYIRDCRGGMGERRFFRTCLKYLFDKGVDINLEQIPVLGRWDDLLVAIGTPYEVRAVDLIFNALLKKDGLCAKWLPRKGKVAYKLAKHFGQTHKQYRKTLVRLTKVVENQMCQGEWKGINYTHVPSVANIKYNKAFLKHDEERRREFLAKAAKGEVKINSSVNFPHDIVKMVLTKGSNNIKEGEQLAKNVVRDNAAIALWNNLPDYLNGSTRRLLAMADTSGSMEGLPMLISVSLALYLSERNKGIFKDAFLTFSQRPYLQYVKGDLCDRISSMKAFHPRNTDLESAFALILDIAVKNRIPKDEMPTDIVVISDMEFDQACNSNQNAFKMIKSRYKVAGYDMPNIVFWNANSRQDNVPVRFNKEGVGLVSGASPAAIKAVLSGSIHPVDIMLRAVNQEKYTKLIA